jgi:hypothetical protein
MATAISNRKIQKAHNIRVFLSRPEMRHMVSNPLNGAYKAQEIAGGDQNPHVAPPAPNMRLAFGALFLKKEK